MHEKKMFLCVKAEVIGKVLTIVTFVLKSGFATQEDGMSSDGITLKELKVSSYRMS